MWGVNNIIKECLELLALIVGIGSVIWAMYTFTYSRNQFHHEVMVSCIERFQLIIPALASDVTDEKLDGLRKYIDLSNEELFYFKGNYIPKEVAVEWLDGMISFLPLFNERGDVISNGKFAEIIENKMLEGYPRILKAFRISKLPNMENADDRKHCIETILENLKELSYPCS
jgi:hypothetical protein